MTDQNDLRERIAAAIYKNQDVVVGDAGEIFGDAAQAVIDEFGLTVDRAVDTGNRSYDKRTGIITNGWKYRVVGKWEKK